MAYRRKWQPSKKAAREFSDKMKKIEKFCNDHGINHSNNYDSYYFMIDGQSYRVSNHTVEKSNKAAYDFTGQQVRELYHPAGRENSVIYIHASKTRIIQIYNDLLDGYSLNGKGYRK